MVLTQAQVKRNRQERILYTLDRLGFATTSQLQEIHKLGQKRNTLRIIKEMESYLHKKSHPERYGENVYYLNPLGREVIGTSKERKWNAEIVEHYLMRNDFFIYLGCPQNFEIEREIVMKLKEGNTHREEIIRCDALYKKEEVMYFLEVDRTQSMSENKKKIERYKKASDIIKKKFSNSPVIVFYTGSKIRKINIEKNLEKTGLKYEIYSREEI
ncbi:hypothetical protein GCM10008967_00520 [Bacillus carboniphilus]|uniref:Replication-relaxation n=1 Tax=Bacillus carboniphilus TaxID=86663 RepID=A0ABN0VPB7_9BACI